jgi:hypothetical protein
MPTQIVPDRVVAQIEKNKEFNLSQIVEMELLPREYCPHSVYQLRRAAVIPFNILNRKR